MITPFSVQNLLLKLKEIGSNSFDIVATKFWFCNEFEKELGLKNGPYSEDIFDFIYNVTRYKKFFKLNRYNEVIHDTLRIDFKNFEITSRFIAVIYDEIVLSNGDYFNKMFHLKSKTPEDNQKELRDRSHELTKLVLSI